MLLYSVIVSPGYFAQLGQWTMVAMFVVLLILALVSIVKVKPLAWEGDRKGT
jgi:hypothetical protein